MAAKKDTNIYDFVDDGTVFTYNRFAEDVLNHLYSQFRVQKRYIHQAQCAENFYKNARTIFFVSRGIKLDQISLRHVMFNTFVKSNATELIGNEITNLYKYMSLYYKALTDYFAKESTLYDSINKFELSFALLVELSLYCIMKGKPNVTKKTARTWASFFENNLKKEFEDNGGINEVLRRGGKWRYLDIFVCKFIPAHCVPYKGEALPDLFTKEFEKFQKEVNVHTSMLRNRMRLLRLDVMTDLLENTMEEEEVDPLRSVPTHDRLGVPLHEEVLKLSFDPEILAPQAEAASTDTSEAAGKAISALSLKEERKEARKRRLSKATMLKHKQSVTEVEASSSAGTKEPETNPGEPTNDDFDARLGCLRRQSPEPPVPSQECVENLQSVTENTPDNYAILGARPKTGMSSKKR